MLKNKLRLKFFPNLLAVSIFLIFTSLFCYPFFNPLKAQTTDTVLKKYKTTINSELNTNSQDNGAKNLFPDYSEPGDANYPAISQCYNLNSSNKDDWYLPSIDELNILYNNKKYFTSQNNGLVGGYYWSSTSNTNQAKSKSMGNGVINENTAKNSDLYVRCIRKVTPSDCVSDPCTNNTKCGWQPNNCGSGANCSCLSNPTNKICDTSNYTCVECTSNSNCSGNKPICNTATKSCQACTTDTECKNILGLNSKPDAVCSNGTCYDSVCANKLAGEDPIVANACTGTCKTGKCDGSGKCQYLNAGDSCAECGVCTVSGSSMNCQATAVTKSSDCSGLTSPCRVCSGSGIGLCIGQVAETAPTKIGATCPTIDCANTVKDWSNNGNGKECERFTTNTPKNGVCKANSGICYGISGLTSAAPAEYNNVCSGSAVINQCIDAECRYACILGDLVANQNMDRTCASKGTSIFGDKASCYAPKKCIAGGDCVECSSNDDCPGACKICSDGSCVNAPANTNRKGQCNTAGCGAGFCNANGSCAYYTYGKQNCGNCQQCNSTGACSSCSDCCKSDGNCGVSENTDTNINLYYVSYYCSGPVVTIGPGGQTLCGQAASCESFSWNTKRSPGTCSTSYLDGAICGGAHYHSNKMGDCTRKICR